MKGENLNAEPLLEFYRKMVLIREVEESLVEPIIQKQIICPCHLCTGQEAVAVGISSNLNDKDYIFGNHRSHGHYLAKGGSLKGLIAEIYCREEGCSSGRGGSMHLIDKSVGMQGSAPIVAGTISLALGAALSAYSSGDGRVAVTYFGDGATGEGVLYECLNFASLLNLPILFVCENNLYSTHMSIDEIRSNRNIASIADAFDIRNFTIDGNDVLQVNEVASEAVEYCRTSGPVFIEAKTYRQRGHVGPDDNIQGSHTDIRPNEEIAEWMERDPIQKLKDTLLEHKLSSESELDSIRQLIQTEVSELHHWAQSLPKPNSKDFSKYVFSED